jgi:hypothetical protein
MPKSKKEKTSHAAKPHPEHVRQKIEETAYYKWANRGFEPGDNVNDWLEAEQEVVDSLKETRD